MVATWNEGIDSIKTILETWNRANTDNIKPVIIDVASEGPERGKRLDLSRSDYIVLYETAHNEEAPDLFYNYVTTRLNITVDARTTRSRSRIQKMENEIRRLIHTNRKGDATNFDRLVFKTRTDLSDRSKKLFRFTFQIEVVILGELIP
tara:strand:- start:2317 stop:2763 length:447 start_codon:yes stop_codon:yes gene_type:complete